MRTCCNCLAQNSIEGAQCIGCLKVLGLKLPQQISNSSCYLRLDKIGELDAPTFSVHVLPRLLKHT